MSKFLRYGFRLGMIVALVAFFSLVLAPRQPQANPYVSALSDLATGFAATAAPPVCAQTKCNGCIHTLCCDNIGQTTKCKFKGSGCTTASC